MKNNKVPKNADKTLIKKCLTPRSPGIRLIQVKSKDGSIAQTLVIWGNPDKDEWRSHLLRKDNHRDLIGLIKKLLKTEWIEAQKAMIPLLEEVSLSQVHRLEDGFESGDMPTQEIEPGRDAFDDQARRNELIYEAFCAGVEAASHYDWGFATSEEEAKFRNECETCDYWSWASNKGLMKVPNGNRLESESRQE